MGIPAQSQQKLMDEAGMDYSDYRLRASVTARRAGPTCTVLSLQLEYEYLGAAVLLASSFARPSSARRPPGAGDAERAFAVADFALSHVSPAHFSHV